MHRITAGFAVLLALAAVSASAAPPSYHVTARYKLGGDGGWDYLTYDAAMHRLYIGRHDRVMVVDPDHGTLIGEVPGIDGAHGVALDAAAGRGFATSGHDGKVVIFDVQTLKVLGRADAAADADAIQFDPATRRVFSFNGDAHSASVIDAAAGRRIGTIPLGAKPEFGVSDGRGKVYVNLESTAQIAEIDARSLRVLRKWSLAPCEEPTGLAMDTAHRRLFSGCRNAIMAVSDADAGKLVATVPIGKGVDACRYDPGAQLAFASTGDGAITVIREDSPDRYRVVQTVATMDGARTMALDPATHRLFTASAERESGPPEPGHHRPPVKPGTFAVLVLAP